MSKTCNESQPVNRCPQLMKLWQVKRCLILLFHIRLKIRPGRNSQSIIIIWPFFLRRQSFWCFHQSTKLVVIISIRYTQYWSRCLSVWQNVRLKCVECECSTRPSIGIWLYVPYSEMFEGLAEIVNLLSSYDPSSWGSKAFDAFNNQWFQCIFKILRIMLNVCMYVWAACNVCMYGPSFPYGK